MHIYITCLRLCEIQVTQLNTSFQIYLYTITLNPQNRSTTNFQKEEDTITNEETSIKLIRTKKVINASFRAE